MSDWIDLGQLVTCIVDFDIFNNFIVFFKLFLFYFTITSNVFEIEH